MHNFSIEKRTWNYNKELLMNSAVPEKYIQRELLAVIENKFIRLEFCQGVWNSLFFKNHPEAGNIINAPACKQFEFMIKRGTSPEQTLNYGLPGIQSRAKIIPDGEWPADNNDIQWLGYDKQQENSQCLDIHYSCANYLFTISYFITENSPEIIREVKLYNEASNNDTLYQIAISLPFFSIGDSASNIFEIYDVRNNLKTLRQPLSSFEHGSEKSTSRSPDFTAMDSDFHHEVSFILQSQKHNLSLTSWGHSTDYEAVSYYYQKNENGISFSQAWFPFCPLTEGRRIHCKRQIISVGTADWASIKDNVRRLKEHFVWTTPAPPANLKQKVIYQIHGFIADAGGFNGVRKKLTHLKQMGVDIIYLPPLAPPEAYLNYQPDRIAHCYGKDDELKQLVTEAHKLDMKIIVDMIAHHIFRQSPEAQIPEFIRYDECGHPLSYSIGAVLTETRNTHYQRYFIDCCKNLVERFDLDGFRFDVAGFQLPNWDMDRITYERPGMGVLGQTELLQKLKAELDTIKPLIYLEEGMGVNGFRYVTHGFIHLIKKFKQDLQNGSIELPDLLKKLQYIFEDKILKERPNVITMYHCKIHDTVLMQQFGTAITGIERALTALIMTADGVPLITQGMERGYSEMIRSLSGLKKRYVEFSDGSMIFDSCHCDNKQIFIFSRKQGKHESIVAINFTNKTQYAAITHNSSFYTACQIFPDSDLKYQDKIEIKLTPFECRIYKMSKADHIPNEAYLTSRIAEISETETSPPILLEKTDSFEISWKNKRIVVNKRDAMISSINNENVQNSLQARMCLSAIQQQNHNPDELNEGAFSGSYIQTNEINEDVFIDESWAQNEYNASHWLDVFVPTTRIPYSQTLSPDNGIYIEDVIPNALNVLWTRHPQLRHGKAYFRKTFICKDKPLDAEININSPAMYDFDLAVQNGGINYPMMEKRNPCFVYINGNSVPENVDSSQIAGMLRVGENIIAVECLKGCGGHGIEGFLKINYSYNEQEIIKTDSSWKCFPGTIFRPIIKSCSHVAEPDSIILKFQVTLTSPDNTSISIPPNNIFDFGYRFENDGNMKINTNLPKSFMNLGIDWQLNISRPDYWFAKNADNSLHEKSSCWNDVRNAYSGSIWPVWKSDEFKILPPLSFGVICPKFSVECKLDDSQSSIAQYFAGKKDGTMKVCAKVPKMSLEFSIK
jgi:hypothetical protein